MIAIPEFTENQENAVLLYFSLEGTDEAAEGLARALTAAKKSIHKCPRCGNYTDGDICSVCADPARDQSLICVVESVADIVSMERSHSFSGVYHVLFGVISPMEGVGPENLNLTALAKRLKGGAVREVVLATNPTVEGEATAL